jgi:hypothetical protein
VRQRDVRPAGVLALHDACRTHKRCRAQHAQRTAHRSTLVGAAVSCDCRRTTRVQPHGTLTAVLVKRAVAEGLAHAEVAEAALPVGLAHLAPPHARQVAALAGAACGGRVCGRGRRGSQGAAHGQCLRVRPAAACVRSRLQDSAWRLRRRQAAAVPLRWRCAASAAWRPARNQACRSPYATR